MDVSGRPLSFCFIRLRYNLNFAPRKFGAGQGGEGDGVFLYMEPLPTLPRAKNLSAIVGRRRIARPAADE